MKGADFKVGTIFLYKENPFEDLTETIGIGEVLTVGDRCIEIKWLWAPVIKSYARIDWYNDRHRENWQKYCTILSEKEKLSLLLKHNFG